MHVLIMPVWLYEIYKNIIRLFLSFGSCIQNPLSLNWHESSVEATKVFCKEPYKKVDMPVWSSFVWKEIKVVGVLLLQMFIPVGNGGELYV